jgi:hypothetical protein
VGTHAATNVCRPNRQATLGRGSSTVAPERSLLPKGFSRLLARDHRLHTLETRPGSLACRSPCSPPDDWWHAVAPWRCDSGERGNWLRFGKRASSDRFGPHRPDCKGCPISHLENREAELFLAMLVPKERGLFNEECQSMFSKNSYPINSSGSFGARARVRSARGLGFVRRAGSGSFGARARVRSARLASARVSVVRTLKEPRGASPLQSSSRFTWDLSPESVSPGESSLSQVCPVEPRPLAAPVTTTSRPKQWARETGWSKRSLGFSTRIATRRTNLIP